MGVLRLRRSQGVPGGGSRRGDPSAHPLADVLRRAGRGDQAAFADLYDELAGVVHGVVLRVIRDPSQSEEVTQEVFVELWRLAARYDESRGSVHSWAATIAHRRAIDRVRSEQSSRARVTHQVSDVAVDYDQVSDEVLGEIEVSLNRGRVRRALARLTPVQRESLELAYFGGHTYRQVAVLLDVPEGTVKTRIRDGMIRLRDEIGDLP